MINGRKKGNIAELQVARILSQIWFPARAKEFAKLKADYLPFRRRYTIGTPLSGSWEGAGDVLHDSTVKDFPFTVECKSIAGWDFLSIFNEKSVIWKWWKQAVEQANKEDKYPLLVFTRPHADFYYIIPYSTPTFLLSDHIRSGPCAIGTFSPETVTKRL